MQQTLLPKKELKYVKRLIHGGERKKPARKIKRPLISGAITHTILKSSKAVGKFSFLKHKNLVKSLLNQRARKYFIEIVDRENMGNHLHLKVRMRDTSKFGNFLRTFMALLARKITGACRGKPFGKFWNGLAYTRVLTTKVEEFELRKYFKANHIEREFGKVAREKFLATKRLGRREVKESSDMNMEFALLV